MVRHYTAVLDPAFVFQIADVEMIKTRKTKMMMVMVELVTLMTTRRLTTTMSVYRVLT